MRCLPRVLLLLGLAMPAGARAADPVNVLYAGSLANLMEHGVGPAFDAAGGAAFRGYAGGSRGLANQIKGGVRHGDVFISADPAVDEALRGAANGDWVNWWVRFAESPLVIGINPTSRFAEALRTRPWQEVLASPGLRLGRTDPRIDPKGARTVALLAKAEAAYRQPGLQARILGADDNPAQVLPEETLVGRLQSGELDAGFFYAAEAADAHIPTVALPPELAEGATYTVTILRDAPNPAGARDFLHFLLGPKGEAVLREHGLSRSAPVVGGDATAVPKDVEALIRPAP